ncbi:MAG: hypothetical protein GOU98_00890 [Candidatus Altiarchaeota archaeon]|nr:hypothetical protein [Candidatus Altiarchaeota archaeon]
MTELARAIELLEEILDDSGVPKNIRDVCSLSIKRLNNEGERIHIRIGATIGMLDELSQDPNLPFHTRTQIWEVASLLETASTQKTSEASSKIDEAKG